MLDYLLKQNDTEVIKFDTIAAKVIPQSKQNELVEIMEDDKDVTYKIRIAAPPEKGKANKALLKD